MTRNTTRRAMGVASMYLTMMLLLLVEGKHRPAPQVTTTEAPDSFLISCPKACQCTVAGEKYVVDCNKKGLNTSDLHNISKHLPLPEIPVVLEFGVNNVTILQKKTLRGPFSEKVQELWLENNKITKIDPQAFLPFHQLTTIGIQRNRLNTLPGRAFSRQSKLTHLWLTGNNISTIPNDTFYGLLNLEVLNLGANQFHELPIEAFKHTPNLVELHFECNHVTELTADSFKYLPKLEGLSLRVNRIHTISKDAFHRSPEVNMLRLDSNELTEYPQALMDLEELRYLYFGHNKITSLPDRAFYRQRFIIRKIDFEDNPLKQIGQWTFSELKHIRNISLVDIADQKMLPDFSGCKVLRHITLTGGKLTSIPDDLCTKLPHLTTLVVSNNNINSLDGIGRCRNLMTLKVNGNKLTKLTDATFENMTSLRNLDLGSNDLTALPDDVFKRNPIETLSLAFNSMTKLPATNMKWVETLNITGNPQLLYIPPPSRIPRLRKLDATYRYHCCPFANKTRGGSDNNGMTYDGPVACLPAAHDMTPCEDLIPSSVFRIALYCIIGCVIVLDLVILLWKVARFCRLFYVSVTQRRRTRNSSGNDSEKKSVSTYTTSQESSSSSTSRFEAILCHMLITDLITCSYFITLLWYDRDTRGNFADDGAWWENSLPCTLMGFVLVAGIQLSLFTLTLAAFERYLVLKYPDNREKHLSAYMIAFILVATWTNALATGVVTMYSDGQSQLRTEAIAALVPETNGATCLPWAVRFPYTVALIAAFMVTCSMALVICLLLYCGKSDSWGVSQTRTYHQLTCTVSLNVLLLAPLAVAITTASAIIGYPSVAEKFVTEVNSTEEKGKVSFVPKFDVTMTMESMLLIIAAKILINSVLYVLFSEDLHSDFLRAGITLFNKRKSMAKKVGDHSTNFVYHNHSQPQDHTSIASDSTDHHSPPQPIGSSYDSFVSDQFSDDVMLESVCYGGGGGTTNRRSIALDSSTLPLPSYHPVSSMSITDDELDDDGDDSFDEMSNVMHHRRGRGAVDCNSYRSYTDGDADIESIGASSGGEYHNQMFASRSKVQQTSPPQPPLELTHREPTTGGIKPTNEQPATSPTDDSQVVDKSTTTSTGNSNSSAAKHSHSSDSSASKDSGIQSEPDYFCSQASSAINTWTNHHRSSTLSSNQNGLPIAVVGGDVVTSSTLRYDDDSVVVVPLEKLVNNDHETAL